MGVFDEYNRFQSEVNERAQERQVYYEHKSYNEVNQNAIIRPSKKNKIFANFMFTCAAVAVLPLGIYVPVFSEVFSESITETKNEVKPGSQDTHKSRYSISLLEVTHNNIKCMVKVDNADLDQDNYYVYLVREEDATDVLFSSIDTSIKERCGIKLDNQVMVVNFTKFMQPTGVVTLAQQTNYALLFVCNDKIEYKQLVSTGKFDYIDKIELLPSTIEKPYRCLNFHVVANENFANYNRLYCVFYIYNSDDTYTPYSEYAMVEKEFIEGTNSSIKILDSEPVRDYELRIYCASDHPEELNYTVPPETQEKYDIPKTLVKDEITYYLIYIHPDKINF